MAYRAVKLRESRGDLACEGFCLLNRQRLSPRVVVRIAPRIEEAVKGALVELHHEAERAVVVVDASVHRAGARAFARGLQRNLQGDILCQLFYLEIRLFEDVEKDATDLELFRKLLNLALRCLWRQPVAPKAD